MNIDPAVLAKLIDAINTLLGICATIAVGVITQLIKSWFSDKKQETIVAKIDHVIDKTPSKEAIAENTSVTKENTAVTQAAIQVTTGSFQAFKPTSKDEPHA